MSAPRLQASWVLSALLALAVAALTFILTRAMAGKAPGATLPRATGEPLTSNPTPQQAQGALAPLPTADQTLAAIVRPSLLEEWAGAVVEQAIEHLSGVSQTARADFVWLPDEAVWGPLTQTAGRLAVGGRLIEPDGLVAVEVVLPQQSQPGGLLNVGRIEREDNVLMLLHTAPATQGGGVQSTRGLAGDVLPGDALRALVQQAGERGVVLMVAYWETMDGGATLALIEALPQGEGQPPATVAPAPGALEVAAPTASPTLVYQKDIRLMVESGLVPLIEQAQHPSGPRSQAAALFAQSHAWVGLLTWSEEGAFAAGRSLELYPDAARTLTLFGLSGEGSTPVTTAFLEARWDGSGTFISDGEGSQRYYGFRLAEVVHWMVLVAEEHGGWLEVAYDYAGDYRALTVVDFQPLPLPPGD